MCDSSGSATNLVGAEPSCSIMEPMETIAQSLGSTTATTLEDDSNSFFIVVALVALIIISLPCRVSSNLNIFSRVQCCLAHTRETATSHPRGKKNLPFCGTMYEPECNDGLQPKLAWNLINGRMASHSTHGMLMRLVSLYGQEHNTLERMVYQRGSGLSVEMDTGLGRLRRKQSLAKGKRERRPKRTRW